MVRGAVLEVRVLVVMMVVLRPLLPHLLLVLRPLLVELAHLLVPALATILATATLPSAVHARLFNLGERPMGLAPRTGAFT
jgi:hypothetical protein